MSLREGSRDSRITPILVEKSETLQCGVEQLLFFKVGRENRKSQNK